MSSNRDLETRLHAALAHCQRLQEEIRTLKELLAQRAIPLPENRSILPVPERCLPEQDSLATVVAPDTNESKIRLFHSLFRGRPDVYAERWRTKSGEWAYRPAGERDWQAFLSSRLEDRKRVDRQTRQYFPLTEDVIRQHLTGRKTVGLYPLLTDESCWLLAADFDKKTWQEDALAFVRTCHNMRVPAYLERSRSGNGGHVWIFFETAVPAVLARKMGCSILTHTMDQRHHLGLDSYDRFFPNQDTMPKGGFGNLIALPLQWVPRQNGNSVFVDENMCAYPDQWRVLTSVQRVSADQVEWIVNDATRRGQVLGVRISLTDDDPNGEPWNLLPSKRKGDAPIQGPFPEAVEVVQSNMVFVPKAGLPEPMLNRLIRMAAFQNPEFYKAQAIRLSTWDKPRVIFCGEEFPQHLALPRGCLQEVCQLLKEHIVRVVLRDERCSGHAIEVTFQGTLHDDQVLALRQALQHDEGVLCAPTAFGKTVVAANMIAERKVSTLVLVHRRQLLDQWRARLAVFLNLEVKSIGQIVGGKTDRTGVIDVALIQSLHHKGEVKDFVAEYGHVVVDECHHLAAFSFEQVMKQVKAKYVLGLTATPTRKDGHQPIIFMQCGPIRFSVSARDAAARSPFQHYLMPRHTNFRMPAESSDATIQDIYKALVSDSERNQQIVGDILEAVHQGLSPLVLTSRTEHVERLAEALSTIENVLVLKGGMGKKQRQALAEKLNSIPGGVPRVILATGSYIGEGFDDSRLDTLFLTMPISWRGTLQQYVGRLHRIHHGKRVVRVYDYIDAQVSMLARMYEKRLKGYEAIGYAVEMPPSRL